MKIRDGFIELGRQHAADQAAPRLGSDRLHDPRQGRVPQPRRLGQGPGGALHHQGCRGARRCCGPAGSSSRAPPGNTGIGLALVGNARGYRTVIVMPETQSQEKKDMLLLCGVDLRLVPAVPYTNPMNYVRYSGRARRRRSRPASRTARSGPTSSTTSPTGAAITRRRARRSGRRPMARSTASSARSAPAGPSPASASRCKRAQPEHQDLPVGPDGLGHLQLVRARASSSRKAVRSPKASATTARPKTSKGSARRPVPDHRRGDAAGPVRPGRRKKGWSSAGRPASMSAARSAWRGSSGRATRSSRSSPIPARAISRSCSTRAYPGRAFAAVAALAGVRAIRIMATKAPR